MTIKDHGSYTSKKYEGSFRKIANALRKENPNFCVHSTSTIYQKEDRENYWFWLSVEKIQQCEYLVLVVPLSDKKHKILKTTSQEILSKVKITSDNKFHIYLDTHTLHNFRDEEIHINWEVID